MSANKHYRTAWVRVSYRETVRLFHEARKREENQTVTLEDLARRCANTVFQERSEQILPGSGEVTAREFMAYCREHIGEEIYKAVCEKEEEPEFDLVM